MARITISLMLKGFGYFLTREEEEEEEEEDDDDDLSKYDLWGNEDAVTKEETQPTKPKSNSPKRSRSKSRSRNRNKRSRRCGYNS